MKRKLTLTQAAVLRFCWRVDPADRERLDKFFLLKDQWKNLVEDFTEDRTEMKRYLRHEGEDYEVILCDPVRILEKAELLGLSFRVNVAANLKVVLIKEWKESLEAVQNG